MSDQSMLIRRVKVAYSSAVIVIAILILMVFSIIHSTINQEVTTRNLSTVMSRQELHSQRLLRNAILIAIGPNGKLLNPLNINPISQTVDDLAFMESTNKALLNAPTPPNTITQMSKIQDDFQKMDDAGHALLAAQKGHNAKTMGKETAIIFIHEQPYLQGVFNSYIELTLQADSDVDAVGVKEEVLSFVSLLILFIEAVFIVRPAIKDYAKASIKYTKVVKELESLHAHEKA